VHRFELHDRLVDTVSGPKAAANLGPWKRSVLRVRWRQIGALSALVTLVLALLPLALVATKADAATPLNIFVGYMDTHAEASSSNQPKPWPYTSRSSFVGSPCPTYPSKTCWDASAIRLDNPGSTDVTDVHPRVVIGSRTYDLWGSNLTVRAHGMLVLTATGRQNSNNFNGSDLSPNAYKGGKVASCANSRAIPVVQIVIAGAITNYLDSAQVLSGGGVDKGHCLNGSFVLRRMDESHPWVQIGSRVTSAPTAPRSLTATAGSGSVSLSWSAPVSDGGAPITGYTVYRATASGGASGTPVAKKVSTRRFTDKYLTNGTTYYYTVAATNAIGISRPSAASAAVPMMGFTGQAPTRVLDTRIGTGAPTAKLGPGVTMTAPVPGLPTTTELGAGATLTLTVPGLPATATAVALNVTTTPPAAATFLTVYPHSFLTVYPGGQTRPSVGSNLNYGPGQTIPNLVLVTLGAGGKVTFYNSAGIVDVIVDVVGYFTPGTGAGFTGQAPTEVLDTRVGTGAPLAKLAGRATLTLTIPGLPAGAAAVALNVTATDPTTASFLSVYPGDQSRPFGSNLNYVAGQTITNLVLVPISSAGTVTFYNNAGTVDVIADLVGSFTPGTGAGFNAIAPTRVLDTRVGTGAPTAKLGRGDTLTVTIPGLPAGTTAVALNVSATSLTADSFLYVYSGGQSQPRVGSNLNYVAGETISHMVLVPLGTGGKVTFYKSTGTVDLIADLVGYYR
jgi:Fibronectin type III domain